MEIATADRFMAAWKALERELRHQWSKQHPHRTYPDAASLLAWAEREHLLSANVSEFLQSCRSARNAYAHVSFEGYAGPVTHPPLEVVHRLERVVSGLRSPARLSAVSTTAVTCTADCSVGTALRTMREKDLSQLPYEHGVHGWCLVTREQVARWLEAEAEADGQVLVDLTTPARLVADHPGVGPVLVRRLSPSDTVPDAVRELEAALHTADHEPGGYPAVLVVPPGEGPVRILTPDDLPRLYDLLGR